MGKPSYIEQISILILIILIVNLIRDMECLHQSEKRMKFDNSQKSQEQTFAHSFAIQNKKYFEIRDALEAQTNQKIWREILLSNFQAKPRGPYEVRKITRLAIIHSFFFLK